MNVGEKHILFVDDDEEFVKIMKKLLNFYGYKVEEALTGNVALEKLKKGKFDLVLVDIMMPGMDGFELMEKMRKIPGSEKLPIIVITAREDFDTMMKSKQAGAVDFIAKPFEPEELKEKIEKVIR